MGVWFCTRAEHVRRPTAPVHAILVREKLQRCRERESRRPGTITSPRATPPASTAHAPPIKHSALSLRASRVSHRASSPRTRTRPTNEGAGGLEGLTPTTRTRPPSSDLPVRARLALARSPQRAGGGASSPRQQHQPHNVCWHNSFRTAPTLSFEPNSYMFRTTFTATKTNM